MPTEKELEDLLQELYRIKEKLNNISFECCICENRYLKDQLHHFGRMYKPICNDCAK